MRVLKLGGRQVAMTCVDRETLVVEREGRTRLGRQRQIRFTESTDGSDVFPVIVEEIGAEFEAIVECLGDDLLTEVSSTGVFSQ